MNLLELSKRIKKKKPEFIKQDYKLKKIKRNWRKPKGIDSKMRLRFRGNSKIVSPGYGSPVEVKGLHSSGLKMVFVASPAELEKVNKDKEGIIIRSGVGQRKRVEIINKAKEKGIRVLSVKDSEAFLKKVSEIMASRKDKKKKFSEKKEKKAKQAKEKETKKEEAEKKDIEDAITDEEKKETEKKEKDKVLTKRN